MIILKKMRIYKGLSQNELAEHLGVSRNYISEIERGKKSISLDMLIKLGTFFGFHPCMFICDLMDNVYPICRTCKGQVMKNVKNDITDEEFKKFIDDIVKYRELLEKSIEKRKGD